MSVSAATAARTLRARRESRASEARLRADRIVERLPAAAAMLRGQFGAVRVWCFGSLVVGTPHEATDADLAVEGISPLRIDAAAAATEAILGCVVDLVVLELADPTLRARVLTDGIAL